VNKAASMFTSATVIPLTGQRRRDTAFADVMSQRVQSACVGVRRAARMAGSSPARAPMRRAAPRPAAHAPGGMTMAQPWARA
jgi:hypothetical protein